MIWLKETAHARRAAAHSPAQYDQLAQQAGDGPAGAGSAPLT
jgi:hypothetical protein